MKRNQTSNTRAIGRLPWVLLRSTPTARSTATPVIPKVANYYMHSGRRWPLMPHQTLRSFRVLSSEQMVKIFSSTICEDALGNVGPSLAHSNNPPVKRLLILLLPLMAGYTLQEREVFL